MPAVIRGDGRLRRPGLKIEVFESVWDVLGTVMSGRRPLIKGNFGVLR
jgi:hypothetical protein